MEIKNIHCKDCSTVYYNSKELDYLVHYLIEFGEHTTIFSRILLLKKLLFSLFPFLGIRKTL